MTELQILFVTRKWSPAVGGMETWSHRLSEELARRADVTVIALPGQANGHPPKLAALVRFPVTALRRYFMLPRAPDVLHLGDMALWPLGLLAWLRPGKTGVVLTSHGTDVSYPRRGGWRSRAYGAYLRLGALLLPRALVTTNSSATRIATHEAGWKNSVIIPLATDLSGRTLDRAPDRHILFVGRLVERKGCAWFIREVLPLLPKELTLHVAGTAIDPIEAAALDDPRAHYLGTLHGEALAQAYREALCVIVPNIEPANGEFEGFGLVATEAAAAGGVPLAADCGGLPAAIIDGKTGFLVKSGAPSAWASAIATVAGLSLSARTDFITKSLALTDKHFRWPRVADQTLAAYRAVLGIDDRH